MNTDYFKELELYFDRIYGRLDYDKYQLEGTIRGYTSIYENFVGDYLICLGNKDDGVPTNYEYIFPWWVKDAYYQIVNNHNWIEEGGINLTSKGYCKDIKTYFWYKNNQDTGVSQVIYEDNKHAFDAITVNKVLINNNQEINSSKIIQSVFDYYEPSDEEYKNMNFKGWFLDRDCTVPYYRNILTCDTTIYGLVV